VELKKKSIIQNEMNMRNYSNIPHPATTTGIPLALPSSISFLKWSSAGVLTVQEFKSHKSASYFSSEKFFLNFLALDVYNVRYLLMDIHKPPAVLPCIQNQNYCGRSLNR
jgi:hypothetical protein